ncbi:hypothetical protein SKAU_G00297240 [Synaphobranchus kaupii]|uniref:Uncharacterized protein n=1 Tax=Synaphobranchus kaupii TaxID=118154 RepID=A0A9Q1EUY6_SYNKA|nr:hypothetical protein SKAU_G00297240 [Synaphobranchus kaupii]
MRSNYDGNAARNRAGNAARNLPSEAQTASGTGDSSAAGPPRNLISLPARPRSRVPGTAAAYAAHGYEITHTTLLLLLKGQTHTDGKAVMSGLGNWRQGDSPPLGQMRPSTTHLSVAIWWGPQAGGVGGLDCRIGNSFHNDSGPAEHLHSDIPKASKGGVRTER